MSAPKYAAFIGIKYQTFATWLQKRRRQGAGSVKASVASTSAPASPDTVKWLEAVVEQRPALASQAHGVLLLQLPGGARVEIADAGQAALAAALIRALSPSC
jgi:hypothetical protein